MAFAAGNKITTDRLNRLQTTIYHAIGSGTVVGAATNSDVTDATVTFTTTADDATYAAVGVWDVDWTSSTTSTGTARVDVDGSPQTPLATFGAQVSTDRTTVSQTYSGTLATAGSHTIKLIASPASGQTIQGVNSSILVFVQEVA